MNLRFSRFSQLWCCAGIVLLLASSPGSATESDNDSSVDESDSPVTARLERERSVQNNRSALLAHKRNYVLPLTYASQPNDDVYEFDSQDFGIGLDQAEIQFQLSIKAPLAEGTFYQQDSLYVGFTVRSFWQAYNNDISAPFRETNYEPEVFWYLPVDWRIFGSNASLFGLGLSHQSNGRSQLFSRSWNRVYANLIWERKQLAFGFKVWWRVPEDDKDDPGDADGDDNPDIEDYMGNFEFTTAYRKNDHEVSMQLRNNLQSDDNRGAIQLDWTFPLKQRFRGYVQFFNGYGESLIDYNAHIERIGVGILLSDLL